MANRGVFSKFVKEFGSKQQEKENEDADEIVGEVEAEKEGKSDKPPGAVAALKEQYEKGKTIMQEEERNIGAVNWKVYKSYLAAGNGYILVPILLLSLVLVQGAQVMSSYWLVFWQNNSSTNPLDSTYAISSLLFLELPILIYSIRWLFMPLWESP
jgi:hypothetical protein